MSSNKLSRIAVLGAGLAFLAAGTPTVASAQSPVILKFGTFVGPTSFLNVGIFNPWFKQIEDESGNKVKIEFLSGGAAAKPNEVIDAVRSGIIDIGWSGTAYNPGRFNAAGVAELPIAKSPTDGAAGIGEVYKQGLLDGFNDVKLLGIATTDVARLHHSEIVPGLSAFKGTKIRAAGGVLSSLVEKLGATPVNVPITSLAESLAKHIVDGAAADWFSMEGFRLTDVTKTHVDLAMGSVGIYLIMNKAKYDQLPPDVKAAFDKHSPQDFGMFWATRLQKESNRVRDIVLQKAGHKLVEPTADETRAWEASGNEVTAAWAKKTANGEAILKAFEKGLQANAAKR